MMNKKTLFFISLSFTFMQIYTDLHQTFNIGGTSTTIGNSNENKVAVTQTQTNTADTSKFLKMCEKNVECLTNFLNQQKKSIVTHPYLCAATICLASYVAINYNLYCITTCLEEHSSWANWKAGVSLTQLQLTNPQELMNQLKTDLYKKYALHSPNIFNCDYTNLFVHDLHKELKYIESYLYWYQITQKIRCSALFHVPFDIQTMQEKKARLLFLLDFFMAWYSKYHESIISSRTA